jgi:NAD(P)-dependent dehydrogenase (short-subunit alcohol dehydrogenase family)
MADPQTEPSAPEFEPEWLERMPPAKLFSLEGKVAVITGAAGGIGRWYCAAFGAAGAKIVATDLALEPTQRMCDALAERGVATHAVAVDLEDDAAAERIVKAAVDRFGRLDILVNNAGINKREPMLEVSREFLEHIWRVDYVSCYRLSQEAARVMIDQGGGSILHIGSMGGLVGLEDVSAYGPLKAALSQLAKVQSVEWSRFGIRINVVAPGFFATPMNATHWSHPTRAPWIMDRIPMCRPGQPAELVGAALLLVSDAGSFITGQTIYVDGGFTAGSRWNVPPGTGYETYQERYAPKE